MRLELVCSASCSHLFGIREAFKAVGWGQAGVASGGGPRRQLQFCCGDSSTTPPALCPTHNTALSPGVCLDAQEPALYATEVLPCLTNLLINSFSPSSH